MTCTKQVASNNTIKRRLMLADIPYSLGSATSSSVVSVVSDTHSSVTLLRSHRLRSLATMTPHMPANRAYIYAYACHTQTRLVACTDLLTQSKQSAKSYQRENYKYHRSYYVE